MDRDPEGHYARLGLAPTASRPAIVTAYRRLARRLHPDVPGTGNVAAFVALKAAYDVLHDPARRRAYDQAAAVRMPDRAPAAWPAPAPEPADVAGQAAAPPQVPGFDRKFLLWIGFLVTSAAAATWLMVAIASGPTSGLSGPSSSAGPPQTASLTTGPQTPGQNALRSRGRTRLSALPAARPSGPADHFILPGLGAATVWQGDPDRGSLRPVGRLPAFAAVHVLGFGPDHQLAAIRLAGGRIGFVASVRLTTGDRIAARQALCADRAGPPPANGEVLARDGSGSGRFAVANRGQEPAVVKLRSAAGRVVRSVYIAPGGRAVLGDVPGGPWIVDLAVGELWSRACDRFAAGEQAQRFRFPIGSGSILALPPELPKRAMPVAIPDRVFAQP